MTTAPGFAPGDCGRSSSGCPTHAPQDLRRKRGDIVVVSAPGDTGKARSAVIVQANIFNQTHASLLVGLLTSDLLDAPLFRIGVQPPEGTGLTRRSQIMVDKIVAMRRERIGAPIGILDDETLVRLNRGLALFLGLADCFTPGLAPMVRVTDLKIV